MDSAQCGRAESSGVEKTIILTAVPAGMSPRPFGSIVSCPRLPSSENSGGKENSEAFYSFQPRDFLGFFAGMAVAELYPDNFSRVHDAVGIKRLLDAAHHLDRRAVFGNHKIHLAVADAVFTGARPFHCQSAGDHSVVKTTRLGDFFRLLRIDHKDQMKIAVSDMPGQCRRNRRLREVALGLGDALGEPRDRHADIGRPAL